MRSADLVIDSRLRACYQIGGLLVRQSLHFSTPCIV